MHNQPKWGVLHAGTETCKLVMMKSRTMLEQVGTYPIKDFSFLKQLLSMYILHQNWMEYNSVTEVAE